jgi:adenylylsulfate kinase
MQKGVTLWFTGLSGAGKTTISQWIEADFKKRNMKVELLDGDAIRKHFHSDLGFSKEDREKNVRLAAFIAKILTRNDIISWLHSSLHTGKCETPAGKKSVLCLRFM